MDAIDHFAFLVPIMMATFGCIFLAMSTFNLPTASAWGIAFLSGALGFAIPLVPMPIALTAIVADILFFASFYYYGEALLLRFGLPLYTRERLAFSAVCLGADCYVVFVQASLHTELLLVDVAISLLLGVPWLLSLRRAKQAIDKALLCISGLVVLDTFCRIMIFTFLVRTGDQLNSFESSSYAYFMQVSAGVGSLSYALIALGSIVLQTLDRYRDAAERDPLTGLLNRRGFDVAVEAISNGRGASGAVMICDIDHFKQVNDRHGHASGDLVIKTMAEHLQRDMPARAIVARFGGEEFVIFIPGATLAEGGVFAQSARMRFAGHDWQPLGIDRQITASFGVAAPAEEDNLHDTISRADRALYAAKSAGRNKVMLDGEPVDDSGRVIPIDSDIVWRKARA
jgi:diguanylate cyclase (GGDEF)-like protein